MGIRSRARIRLPMFRVYGILLFNISAAGAYVDPERGKESFVFFLA